MASGDIQVGCRLIGAEELKSRLRIIGDLTSDPAFRDGIKRAGTILIEGGKSVISSTYKDSRASRLRRSLDMRVKKKEGYIGVVGFKNPGRSDKKKPVEAYPVWENYGTDYRYTKQGKYTGRIMATHFWEHNIQLNSSRAVEALADGVEQSIIERSL